MVNVISLETYRIIKYDQTYRATKLGDKLYNTVTYITYILALYIYTYISPAFV